MGKSKKMAALILAAMLAVSSSAAMAVTVSAEEDTAVAYSSSDTESWSEYDYQILDPPCGCPGTSPEAPVG